MPICEFDGFLTEKHPQRHHNRVHRMQKVIYLKFPRWGVFLLCREDCPGAQK